MVSDADIRIPRLADRADRCKCCPLAADAVCVSKRVVAAAAGVRVRRCTPAERNGPHGGDHLRTNRLDHSLRAAGAGVLFFASTLCRIDLPFYAIGCVASKSTVDS